MGYIGSTSSKTPASKTTRRVKKSARPGLRPVRIWIPDFDEWTLRREAHRQSLAVATSTHAREDQDFIDAITTPE
jgi:hypothetical protein